MTNWLWLAVIGHFSNAVAFIIDKALLTSAFKRSATYAALIGSLSFLGLLGTPFVKAWPSQDLLPYVVAFGGLFVLALWGFFEALQRAEASRVVPIIGSLIPIFTLIGSSFFFAERFTSNQWIGFLCLLAATWILSGGGKSTKRLDAQTLAIAVLSASLFAASTLFGKYVFVHGDVAGGFVASRVFAGLVGLVIGLAHPGARQEIITILKPKTSTNRLHATWAIVGQMFGGAGFILVQLAIADGSPTIVNALQAVQYAAIVLVAWFGGMRLRALLKEERTTRTVVLKTVAIAAIGVGLALLT